MVMILRHVIILFFLLSVNCDCYSRNIKQDTSRGVSSGVFMTAVMVDAALNNAEKDSAASNVVSGIIKAANPWLGYTYDQLWEMMFGNTIKRSWMVWSDGYCPSCKKSVPMYTWVIDPFNKPWKVTCPHCNEDFPKNDFEKFYRSGIDDFGIFNPARADSSLLFNTEHPGATDPMHHFCVDDGEGWTSDSHRWRFIGAYLIYGQWKRLIVDGITKLAEAYVLTGDKEYSRRAGILLDRVADLYPTHDFAKQGLVYENQGAAGYVSTWHDACQETKELAVAYDMVKGAISRDEELTSFLSGKTREYRIPFKKDSPADIIFNIENGLINDPQKNRGKIYSNYPQTDMTLAILKRIVNTPSENDSCMLIIDSLIKRATTNDGLTGEKGLTGYSAYGPGKIAEFLSLFSRSDPEFLPHMIRQYPGIVEMFRFFIDTWCGMQYYPNIGDCDGFALPDTNYKGIYFSKNPGLKPSMYTFLWDLYRITGDADFVKVLYNENGNKSDGLPYDIFSQSSENIRKEIDRIITLYGREITAKSTDKKNWHLALLKGGSGINERTLWLDYDAGGYHSHADGLNLGLFAFGLDLLPDFGYPPVQFGGWESEKAKWYAMTAAHNTVIVNGHDQINLAGSYHENKGFYGEPAGKTTLWADGKVLKAVRAELPRAYNIEEYERTAAMIDISRDRFYIIDLFRVRGGYDHARMTYSGYGTMETSGLVPGKGRDYGYKTLLRNFRTDTLAKPGWKADWTIDARYSGGQEDVHLRITDLSENVEVSLAEAWVIGGFTQTDGEWIPSLVTRRRGSDSSLVSEFVSVIEPCRGEPVISSARRIFSEDKALAVIVDMADGSHDLWIQGGKGTGNYEINDEKAGKIKFRGDMLLVRYDQNNSITDISLINAALFETREWSFNLSPGSGLTEVEIIKNQVRLITGSQLAIRDLRYKGKPCRLRVR